MGKITMEELHEIMEMLEKAGLDPQICDTPVPYYDALVQAGIPTDPGDVSYEGMEWMPSELVNTGMMIIKVRGESMRDAGFCSGDRVLVDYDTSIVDGDIVVAMMRNGEATLKSYITDNGEIWLVPHNPDFEAIRVTEENGIVRIGKVVQLIKNNPRMGLREISKIMERTRRKMMGKYVPSREEVRNAIRVVAPLINEKRKWHAVYRVLVDRDVLCLNDYETFVQWVNEDVPDHEHLPDVQDLPRVSYASFSKPVSKWDADDAPVKGKRFRDYCEIARIMDEEL